MAAKPRKKKEPALSKEAMLDIVRRLMKSTGFDEEEQEGDRIHFGSREDGDMENDRADPGLIRFALTKAKEIEAAIPGSKVRVEPVDEWVTIDVTLPSASTPKTKTPKTPKAKPAPLPPAPPPAPQQRRYLQPGDEVDYTNFTIGGSFKGKAIVTWDHGKSGVEARTLSGERLRLERAADGSLRRFT